jgi:hypothetical protein
LRPAATHLHVDEHLVVRDVALDRGLDVALARRRALELGLEVVVRLVGRVGADGEGATSRGEQRRSLLLLLLLLLLRGRAPGCGVWWELVVE